MWDSGRAGSRTLVLFFQLPAFLPPLPSLREKPPACPATLEGRLFPQDSPDRTNLVTCLSLTRHLGEGGRFSQGQRSPCSALMAVRKCVPLGRSSLMPELRLGGPDFSPLRKYTCPCVPSGPGYVHDRSGLGALHRVGRGVHPTQNT